MKINFSRASVAISALTLPGTALAQNVSPIIAALALSPILVFLLAIVLGVVTRSWRVGTRHIGLVCVWIVLFAIASYWVENDYVIWTPLMLYGTHAITMIFLIVKGVLQQARR
jgi:MFS-type transporter involved in bile tolerance (Atg22 family)